MVMMEMVILLMDLDADPRTFQSVLCFSISGECPVVRRDQAFGGRSILSPNCLL